MFFLQQEQTDFILPDIIAKYIEKIQHLPAFTVMHYEVDVV